MVGSMLDITQVKEQDQAIRKLNEELQARIAELEKFEEVVVGRELKMIQLERIVGMNFIAPPSGVVGHNDAIFTCCISQHRPDGFTPENVSLANVPVPDNAMGCSDC
jgi:hypothetical protein